MKKLLVGSAGLAAGLGLAGAGAAAYVAKMVQGRATGDIDGFLDRKDPDGREAIVCVGASIVRGRASVDFVDMLRSRAPQYVFVNGGVNSDTSDDVLQRLDAVIACQPSKIIILVGTSDAQGILNPESAASKKKMKETGNAEPPTVETFKRNLSATVTELAERTGARIGICSLPPLGQSIDSPPNEIIRELNAAIKEVAESAGETYLPVYERMVDYLAAAEATDGKPFTGDWRIGARSLSQHFIVGRSYDVIAEREGLLLSPDYVHLNTAGASIVADVCQEFVGEPLSPAGLATPPPAEATPASAPTQEPAVAPAVAAEPVAAPVAEVATEPVAEPVAEVATEPVAAPVAEVATEPVAEPVAEVAAEPVVEPIAPVAEPVAPVAEPVTVVATDTASEPPPSEAEESVPAPRPAAADAFTPTAEIKPESTTAAKSEGSPSPYGG